MFSVARTKVSRSKDQLNVLLTTMVETFQPTMTANSVVVFAASITTTIQLLLRLLPTVHFKATSNNTEIKSAFEDFAWLGL